MAADPVVCPSCRYTRRATDTAPAWQCPGCGIAYAKHKNYIERTKSAVAPRRAGDPVPAWSADASIWALLGVNILTLALALHQHWSATSLMIVYWAQSVIIGISYMLRILSLEQFSTENFTINDKPVEPTPATKRQVGTFFALHYGFFHFVYFSLMVGISKEPLFTFGFFICTLAFALNHMWSYRYNRELDRRGKPNIGTMMFTPYLRIVPMHLTIIFGGIATTSVNLLLFGVLKTAADIGMHIVEHRYLQKATKAPTTN
jgi:hypothetical protein